MSNDAIIPTDDDIIDQINALPIQAKRAIAEALRLGGDRTLDAESTGKRHSYRDYFAIMLWDAITFGEIHFADGKILNIQDDPKAWIEISKFVANHLDGPVSASAQFTGVNVFKVYQNIDMTKI